MKSRNSSAQESTGGAGIRQGFSVTFDDWSEGKSFRRSSEANLRKRPVTGEKETTLDA